MKWKHETISAHRVHVEISGRQLRDMLLDKVAEELKLDPVEVYKHLRVDVSDGVSATSYVRGEVPMTRDEQLASLGLTPTEPVETDGAAVAQDLGDHVTGTSDVVETPETLAAFEAAAGDPDQVLRGPRPGELDELERVGLATLAHTPGDPAATSLLKVVAALRRQPGPARGPNSGVQLGAGEYPPGAVKLLGARVDQPAATFTTLMSDGFSGDLTEVRLEEPQVALSMQSVLNDLGTLGSLLSSVGGEVGVPSVSLGHAVAHLSLLTSLLQKYRDCVLVEGGRPPVDAHGVLHAFDDFTRGVGTHPVRLADLSALRKKLVELVRSTDDSLAQSRLVPRPLSEDSLRQARLKLAELAAGPKIAAGRATATDLHYILSLLGGEL